MHCLMARIDFIPFKNKMEIILSNPPSISHSSSISIPNTIDYRMRFDYPFEINKYLGHKPRLTYFFLFYYIQVK